MKHGCSNTHLYELVKSSPDGKTQMLNVPKIQADESPHSHPAAAILSGNVLGGTNFSFSLYELLKLQ